MDEVSGTHTYRRVRKIVSTWKKSQASRPSAWVRRNARQEVSEPAAPLRLREQPG
jgi:hypothetical protein